MIRRQLFHIETLVGNVFAYTFMNLCIDQVNSICIQMDLIFHCSFIDILKMLLLHSI